MKCKNQSINTFNNTHKTARETYRLYGCYIAIAANLFLISPEVFAQASLTTSVLQVISIQGLETPSFQNLLELDIAKPGRSEGLSGNTSQSGAQKAAKLFRNGDFVVYASPDGRYYVPGKVNGFPVRLMVDSGSDVSLLPTSLAQQAGISQLIKTADGELIEFKKSHNIIRIGNRYINNAHVLAVDRLETSRLGSDVLNQLDITYANGMMTIKRIK